MKLSWIPLLLALSLPATALAGAQYTAEDIIRFFQHANAASDASRIEEAGPPGISVNAPAVSAARDPDAPLVIPFTGVKGGHREAPVAEAAAESGGYDLLITFELDSARLTGQARENLDAFAAALAAPSLARARFVVEGHTDATGSATHNLELSEARAAAVVAYLVAHGVAADRLVAHGYGESRPRTADPTRAQNRRVEARRLQ